MQNFKIRNTTYGDTELTAENTLQILEFKQVYLDKLKADKTDTPDIAATALRFFAMGKELKDELFIYSYDLIDGLTVQAMIRQ